MATKKTVQQQHVLFLRESFRLEHDGDNYILRIHCRCRRMPHYEGTPREWLQTGAVGKTIDTIKRHFMRILDPPFAEIAIESMDEALDGIELTIPASLTRRKPVVPETPAA